MRLSKGAISYILDLQKNKLPQVCCISNLERFEILKEAIVNYSGKVKLLSNDLDGSTVKSNTLLIFMDELNEKNLFDVEKTLISNGSKAVLLEIKGIDSSINKRNLALNFLNRYNLDVIKGTREEIQTLINFNNNNIGKINCNLNFEYRDFAKKNDVILIIKGNSYFITDGYSEFTIENFNDNFVEEDYLEDIHSSMVSVGLGVCNNKCEIIQSILISTLAFSTNELDVLEDNLKDDDNNYYKKDIKNFLDKINNVTVDKIRGFGDIKYEFKRKN